MCSIQTSETSKNEKWFQRDNDDVCAGVHVSEEKEKTGVYSRNGTLNREQRFGLSYKSDQKDYF